MTMKKRIAAFAATALMAVSAAVAAVPANAAKYDPCYNSIESSTECARAFVYGDYTTRPNAAITNVTNSGSNLIFTVRLGNQWFDHYDIDIYTPYGVKTVATVEHPKTVTSNSATVDVTVPVKDITNGLNFILNNKDTRTGQPLGYNNKAASYKLKGQTAKQVTSALFYNYSSNAGYLGFRLQPWYLNDDFDEFYECTAGYCDEVIIQYNTSTKKMINGTFKHENVSSAASDAYHTWFASKGFKNLVE